MELSSMVYSIYLRILLYHRPLLTLRPDELTHGRLRMQVPKYPIAPHPQHLDNTALAPI